MENCIDLSLFKESSIGTNVDSPESKLKVDMQYTAIGWFFVWFFGTTRMPIKISFICIETGELFEVLEDEDLIEHYMLYCRK